MLRKLFPFIGAIVAVSLLAGAALADETIKIIVNGKEVRGDVPAQIIDGRTMIPVRLASEALGATVQWDGKNNSVIINTPSNSTAENQHKLLKVDGEMTTWPYWYEKGSLYMEYHDTVGLLNLAHPHPASYIYFNKAFNTLSINDRSIESPMLSRDGYTLISISYLKDSQNLLNYNFDPDTGEMNLLPIK